MKDSIEVKISNLRLVYESLLPIKYRLNSILEDVFTRAVTVGEPDKALLLEFCAHANTLKLLFEEYFERDPKARQIRIPKEDYMLLISMAKSVEAASRASFGNISLWEN